MSSEGQNVISSGATRQILEQYSAGKQPFQPVLWYDPRLDWIQYLNRDCSYTDFSLTPSVSLLLANYPDFGRDCYCGFILRGGRRLLGKFSILVSEAPTCPERLLKVAESTLVQERSAIIRLLQIFGEELLQGRTLVELPEASHVL